MSTFDETFSFQIHPRSPDNLSADDAQITVYDGQDEIVYAGQGRHELALPKGLYVVRAEFSGEMQEQVVRHAGPSTVDVDVPARHSPIPLFGTASTHEYYAYPSQDLSHTDTAPPIGTPGTQQARLFLFVRMPMREAYTGQNMGQDLYLIDFEGHVLTDLSPDVTVQNTGDGFLAFSAPSEPGRYLLRFTGRPARDLPVYLYEGWETQIFVTYQSRPLLEEAAILLAPLGMGFAPDNNEVAHSVDMALSGLQNNQEVIPQQVMQRLLSGKLDNPMLGLLGAHLMLRRPELDSDVLSGVLDNLDALLPGSPDVRALRLMVAQRFGTPLPQESFSYPPMLRAGLEAVIALDVKEQDLVAADDLIERLSVHQYTDSAWSSWAPIVPLQTEHPDISPKAGWMSSTAENPWQQFSTPESVVQELVAAPEESPEQMIAPSSTNWLAASLIEAVEWSQKAERDLDLGKFAQDLSISVRQVKRAYQSLSETLTNEPEDEEPDQA